jgi:TPR repeat protein
VKWFRASAEKEEAEGINNLAVMLDQGLGVPADRDAAMALFEKAARRGDASAAFNFSQMLLRDLAPRVAKASRRDAQRTERLVLAYSWLNVAASLGHSDAVWRRELVGSELSAAEIASAQAKSIELAAR